MFLKTIRKYNASQKCPSLSFIKITELFSPRNEVSNNLQSNIIETSSIENRGNPRMFQ